MSPEEPLDDESEPKSEPKSESADQQPATATAESEEPEQASGSDDSDDPVRPAGTGEPPDESTETDASAEDEDGEETIDPKSISNIERIVMDADELVRAFAYNGQEDISEKGKVVFSLTPPFTEAVEPTLRHLEEDSREGKVDGEIHLRPFRFVVDGRQVIEQRPTRRLAIEELEEDEPDETTIETWLDEAMETWTSHVRDNLAESVDIFSPNGMAIVRVEYEGSSESVEA
ncbi:MAG: hypothetical protein ACQET5_08360 [Halobacteriota archaeon]|uniref:hypothetical protein n=1 Tax=Natronomonas sp. TaxID=2184060 RepID=UPI003975AC09